MASPSGDQPNSELPTVKSRRGLNAVPNQDDLYVNMIMLKVVADSGFDAPAAAFAKAFANAGFGLGHANAQARQNVLAGVPPDKSGHPLYNVHDEDIDFQIEADFIGLISPGVPQAAARMCNRVGHIMNHGDGFYGGVFVAALYEAALVQNDLPGIVASALNAIPPDSGYAKVIQDALRWHKQYPNDWKTSWRELQKKWDISMPQIICPSRPPRILSSRVASGISLKRGAAVAGSAQQHRSAARITRLTQVVVGIPHSLHVVHFK
jgi:hypothetical protein